MTNCTSDCEVCAIWNASEVSEQEHGHHWVDDLFDAQGRQVCVTCRLRRAKP